MKRVLVSLSLLASTCTVATAATPVAPSRPAVHAKVATAPKKSQVAPADEYFGKLKMSILGIRNTIKDLGLKVDADQTKAPTIFNAADLTEDAIRDWQRKYPHDSWLPGTYYALSHMYTKVATDEARMRAKRAMSYLVAHFPRTKFARDGKVELASNQVGAPVVAAAPDAAPDAASPASAVVPPAAASGSVLTASSPVVPAPVPAPAASSHP